MAGIKGSEAPAWDRFAHWPRWPARILLIAVCALCVLAALTPLTASMDGEVASVPAIELGEQAESAGSPEDGRDDDLALYDRIIARVAAGENYYVAAVEEQRAGSYPVRPGLAVRLPTLAHIHALLGEDLLQLCAFFLLLATVWAWWRRFGEEAGGERYRNYAAALVLIGGSIILNRYYSVLHEFWTGMLIALSLGLHRPGRWKAPLAIAALALAIREHALPFVMLMAAMAFWRRNWREGAAWSALVGLFALVLASHLGAVDALVRPNDPEGPGWLVVSGLSGWLSKIVLSSNLRFLPHVIAGPLALLMVLGWAGWKTPAGATATLLFLGYGLAFMIAGRANNFYWGAVITPMMFIGLALIPMALKGLVSAAFGRPQQRAG